MKVHGVDPRVIDAIQNKTLDPPIRETQESKAAREYQEHERREQQGDFSEENLKQSLKELNEVYESFRNPVRFRLSRGEGETKVEVVDSVEDRVLKTVEPGQVLSAMTQVEKLLGLLVDTMI